MKKENDEIPDLFRTRLADAGMSVRDGFWEELSQEISVHQHIIRFAPPLVINKVELMQAIGLIENTFAELD